MRERAPSTVARHGPAARRLGHAPRPPAAGELGGRYTPRELVGTGGMGAVWRVWDSLLQREVAMKILHGGAAEERVATLLTEVRLVAAMDHPGVVPVHEVGRLVDHRPFFTMKLVEGTTLAARLDTGGCVGDVSESRRSGPWLTTTLDVLERVARTVAWAHAWRGGVLHRDLKPANIMLGAYGEVYVLDWGIALFRSEVAGALAVGTPAYMAPEQRWAPDGIDARADVYSLGAILYEVLTGRPPALADGREALPAAPVLPGTEDLHRLCAQALAPDAADRLADAQTFADHLSDWLIGAGRRERALALVHDADALLAEVDHARAEARATAARACALAECTDAWAPPRTKRGAWLAEAEAEHWRSTTENLELERVERLHAALRIDPDLPEGHARLAAHYQARQMEAEERRDATASAVWATLLRGHDRDGRYTGWLAGGGSLSLESEPPGAEVLLFRVERAALRRQARLVGSIGLTPLEAVGVPHGDHILLVRAPGVQPIRLPIHIPRGGQAARIRPGASGASPLRLPPLGTLGPPDRYVPGGWFRYGGDEEATDALPAGEVWVDDFVIQRFPVTVGEWFVWLNTLVVSGRTEEAAARAPARRRDEGRSSWPCWRWEGGRMVPDFREALTPFGPEWPITNIRHEDAIAYATWWAAQTGRPWRLPHELEREKAARGVDARRWPWGDGFDPAFASMVRSHAGPPERVDVTTFPFDRSPYGVRGLAGNTRDWCANAYTRRAPDPTLPLDPTEDRGDPRYRLVRGGAWLASAGQCRAAARFVAVPDARTAAYGVRLVWSPGADGWGGSPRATEPYERR